MNAKSLPPNGDAQHWQRIRDVLERALELPEDERAAFLDRECGAGTSDRDEVESLLAAVAVPVWFDRPLIAPDLEVTAEVSQVQLAGERIGPYELQELIGVGGMGTVYRAVDTRLGRRVALKVISRKDGTREERARFLREAKAASSLNHPNIVTIYEYDSAGDRDFIAMEFIDGRTLRQLLDTTTLPLPAALAYAKQVAAGLARAHSVGIVHRDLKPNNIMVNADGVAKVLDFGLARQATLQGRRSDDVTADATVLTTVGAVLGTPAYMSPEQATGEPVDYRSDIFSFGIVLYEIACGKSPFKGPNPRATMHQIATLAPQPVNQVNRSVPRQLAELIDHCLQKNPADRPPSMAAVADCLDGLIHADVPAAKVSRRYALIAGLAAIGAGIAWYSRRAVVTDPQPVTAPEPKLKFSVEAQQLSGGQPAAEPRTVLTAEVFEGVWRFRLHAEVLQAGFVYFIDDGPDRTGVYQLSVLASASLAAGQRLETKWFRLEGKPGTERLWVVWAKDSIPDLDSTVSGGLADEALAGRIRALLASLAPGSQTGVRELRGSADTLGALLELQHR
jgi:predicted Ser/Thr protein kinase